jgi:hypothetical protein
MHIPCSYGETQVRSGANVMQATVGGTKCFTVLAKEQHNRRDNERVQSFPRLLLHLTATAQPRCDSRYE